MDEAYANARDALDAVIELYAEQVRTIPSTLTLHLDGELVWSKVVGENGMTYRDELRKLQACR